MSAEILRRAASLMRERAELASDGEWSQDVRPLLAISDATHAHAASWHPAVALAVAKAMEDVAVAWENCDGWTVDFDEDPIRFEDTVDGGWLAVARTYLGGAA